MHKGIGIDFGTTNSTVALARDDGNVESVRFKTTTGTTETYRSVLYFETRSTGIGGPVAIERYLAAGEKGRLIQSLKSFLASRLFTGTSVYGKQFSLEDLIAIMLRDIRLQAESQIGPLAGPIAVGRPIHYSSANTDEDNEFAMQRLTRAFAKAGIGPVVFEYEPVAAASFYESTLDHDELVLIGDFGGGTSDFSILRLGPSARQNRSHRILGTEGVALAGDAFDSRVVHNLVSPKLGRGTEYRSLDKVLPMPEWIFTDLSRWHYLSFLKSPSTLEMLERIQRTASTPERLEAFLLLIKNELGYQLHEAVQRTKFALSTSETAEFAFESGPVTIRKPIARADFEKWIGEEIAAMSACVDRLMAASGLAFSDIDRVFLTGGSSFVPAVRRIFIERFGETKVTGGEELTSVATGLALRAREQWPADRDPAETPSTAR